MFTPTRTALATLFALTISTAVAAPVPIVNPSFETATLPILVADANINNVFTGTGTLAGWNPVGPSDNTAYGGAFQPFIIGTYPNWTNTWWSGANMGYLFPFGNTGPFHLEQTLVDTLQNDTIYDLSVLVARRPFDWGGPLFVYDVQLLAGSTILASGNQLNLAVDSAGLHTVSYNSGSANPLVNQPLSIRLIATGPNEVSFDDVSLEANGVPEPGAWAMMLTGLGALGYRLRRRRQSQARPCSV